MRGDIAVTPVPSTLSRARREEADVQSPLVFVVLLNWNGWPDTLVCLETVLSSDYPRVRVVVCDNDSQDGSFDRIRDWAEVRGVLGAVHPSPPSEGPGSEAPVTLIQTGDNLGFTGGCNVGIAYALARGAGHVFLLNNDARVEPWTLSHLVAAVEESGAGIAGARVFDETGQRLLFSGAVWPWLLFGIRAARARAEGGAYWKTDQACGCSIMLSRDLLEERFREYGYYFDPSLFMYTEEVDLCRFGISRGYECVIVRDAVIYHGVARSSGGPRNPRSYYYITRNKVRLANRWLSGPCWALFHAYFVPSRLIIQAIGSARRRSRAFGAVMRGLADGYLGVSGKWDRHGGASGIAGAPGARGIEL
jgi:GT2 family glycosyltransferase